MSVRLALGLMSGTSMDGIDVALLETDGRNVARPRGGRTFPYPPTFRKRLERAVRAVEPPLAEVWALEHELTRLHAEAIRGTLEALEVPCDRIALVGFHGHTLRHRPARGETVQLGDGPLLARLTGWPVVWDFRRADVAGGGQGAPLVPIYHACLLADRPKPQAVLNLGGIANLSWVGAKDALYALDVAPCNALFDDWMARHGAGPWDEGGRRTLRGRPDAPRIARFLAHPFFSTRPPRSLDRLDFAPDWLVGLGLEDGLATIAHMLAEALARALAWFPAPPRELWLTGGGRHNRGLVEALGDRLRMPVRPMEELGHDGDLLEAEAFAYLAVRVVEGLPTSFPGTTGVAVPTVGGRLALPTQPAGNADHTHEIGDDHEGGSQQQPEGPFDRAQPGGRGEGADEDQRQG